MKRRVLIIYTGGTIGMEWSECGYVPMAGFRQLLAAQLKTEAAEQLPDYQLTKSGKLIDCANLNPLDWTWMGKLILKCLPTTARIQLTANSLASIIFAE